MAGLFVSNDDTFSEKVSDMMKKKLYPILPGFALLAVMLLLSGCRGMSVLDPHGPIGEQEAYLIKVASLLMLIVVVPVFVLTLVFALRYRATNKKADYRPNWAHSTRIEWLVWMVPVAIVAALSYLTWVKTHELDPYKPLDHDLDHLNIEVVSTDWNWLFIYPDHNIAAVNELVVPAGVPLSFKLTSASVMTSFFIPQLGSQMYVMAGMQTQLHLLADSVGVYEGQNMEYSGNGYSTMHFPVRSVSQHDFRTWLENARQSNDQLTLPRYEQLIRPGTDYPVTYFSAVKPGLFNHIMMQYMGWMGGEDHQMNGHDMPMHGGHDSTKSMSGHGPNDVKHSEEH